MQSVFELSKLNKTDFVLSFTFITEKADHEIKVPTSALYNTFKILAAGNIMNVRKKEMQSC